MDLIRVNTDMLSNDADQMMTDVKMIESDLESLNGCINSLNSMWTGTAHSAFESSFKSGYEKMTKYLHKLEKISKRLD